MPSFLVSSPYELWSDEKGEPLEYGYIYIGTSGLNPETNQIQAYWDLALTIPAAQPIRTLAGYPSRQGSPSRIYVASSDFSQTVKDKNRNLVYSELSQIHPQPSAGNTTVADVGGMYDGVNVEEVLAEVNSSVDTIAALRLVDPTTAPGSKKTIFVRGHTSVDDGGSGQFYWDSASIIADDDGVTVKVTAVTTGRWVRLFSAGRVDAAWYGLIIGQEITAQLDAAAAIGMGFVTIPAGSFIVDTVDLPDGVILQGAGSSRYDNEVTYSATVLTRKTGVSYAVSMGSFACGLVDLDIDGNGGRLAAAGDGISAVGGDYCLIKNVKVFDCHYAFAGDGGDVPGVFHFIDSVFRNSNQGIRNFRDSLITGCTISANYQRGIYCNQGNNTISDCYIEWNRDQDNLTNGVPNAAQGIYLDSNCTEMSIDGTRFDRNAGSSIFIGNGAQQITVGPTNQFKGCGWGGDLSDAQRLSVFVNGAADVLNLAGGTIECRNHGPSTIQGPYTPLAFADLGSSTRVTLGLVNDSDVCNPLDLNSKDLTFVLSGSGTNEYYLTTATAGLTVSPIIEPDFTSTDYAQLTAGSIGTLAVEEWAWGDNDTLGYSTVYVRLTAGNPTAAVMHAHYAMPIIEASSATDIQNTSYRDSGGARIAATAVQTFVFKTRELLTPTESRIPLMMHISGEQETSTDDSFQGIPFLLKRGSTAEITIVEGNVQDYESGGAAFAIGWTSSADRVKDVAGTTAYYCIQAHTSSATDEPGIGANWEDFWVADGAPTSEATWLTATAYDNVADIQLSITASVLGDEITVSVRNTDLTRFADILLSLKQ